jgi:hypothetical protein
MVWTFRGLASIFGHIYKKSAEGAARKRKCVAWLAVLGLFFNEAKVDFGDEPGAYGCTGEGKCTI